MYKKLLIVLVTLIMVGGLIRALISFRGLEPGASAGPGAGRVWSEEHQHWH